MSKMYRTANGKLLDIERLRLANERAPALGNMSVNARGDKIASNGKIIKTRAQLMEEYNRLHGSNVPTDTPVQTKIQPDGE